MVNPFGARDVQRRLPVRHPHRPPDIHRAVEAAVAAAFSVPCGELRADTRRAPVAFARQSAMYLAHVTLGLSFTEVGRAFGRDRTTAAHACRLIEDRREDPLVDAVVDALEHAVAALRDRRTASGAVQR